MLVITWNVNSIRVRLARLLELLETHRPDVVCLQETRVAPTAFPHLELAVAGYHAVDHSAGHRGGVALLVPADSEATGARFGLDGEPRPEEARWVEADVRGLRIASAYVPHGRRPDHPAFVEKLAFLDAIRRRALRLAGAGAAVVAGDLNVAPTDDDLWAPARYRHATHITPDERCRIAALSHDGLVDAWLAAGEGPRYTWWSHARDSLANDRGMRIDLTLVTGDVGVRRCLVDRSFRTGDRPSDHAPLLTWLDR